MKTLFRCKDDSNCPHGKDLCCLSCPLSGGDCDEECDGFDAKGLEAPCDYRIKPEEHINEKA